MTKTLNIVVPMAGEGSRFAKAGYSFPKPLIDVEGSPMISRVIDNLKSTIENPDSIIFHFIVKREHLEKYDLQNILKRTCLPFSFTVTVTNKVTEGAACTVLLASEHINNTDRLLIANSDQLIDWKEMEIFMDICCPGIGIGIGDMDGLIQVFKSDHPKWSYVRMDASDKVVEVAEKKVISEWATTGLYFFAKGSDFVEAATEMIRKDIRHNNEFYLCPVYNELILGGKLIKALGINPENMHGLGTPEDLQKYLSRNQ